MKGIYGSVCLTYKLFADKQVKNRVTHKSKIQRAERCNVSVFIK